MYDLFTSHLLFLSNILYFCPYYCQILTIFDGYRLKLKVFIESINLPVQIGLNHKDWSIKTSLFSVFSSLGLVQNFSGLFQSWSGPISVFFQS